MRVRPLLLLLVLLAPVAAAAQPAPVQRAFEDGTRLLRQGDYRGAVDAYEAALDAGYASGALYYNLGNAYYRLDDLGRAVRAYEQARRLLPDAPELAHNVEIVRSRMVDAVPQRPVPFWQRAWERLVHGVGPTVLFVAGLAAYLLALVLVALRLVRGRRGAWHRRALALAVLAGGLLLALAFAASWERARPSEAVVVADAAPLRAAPEAGAASELDVHAGLLLDVVQARPGWLEVRLPNGVQGWIAADAAAPL